MKGLTNDGVLISVYHLPCFPCVHNEACLTLAFVYFYSWKELESYSLCVRLCSIFLT